MYDVDRHTDRTCPKITWSTISGLTFPAASAAFAATSPNFATGVCTNLPPYVPNGVLLAATIKIPGIKKIHYKRGAGNDLSVLNASSDSEIGTRVIWAKQRATSVMNLCFLGHISLFTVKNYYLPLVSTILRGNEFYTNSANRRE